MACVQDVAKFFIDLAQKQSQQDSGDLVTHLRLQKLIYFAQGWHLARYDRPLFDAPIIAWKYGPAVNEVYQTYSANHANGITSDARTSADAFTSDEYALLLDVAREYDRFATSALVDMTHEPESPWAQVKLHEMIPVRLIRDHFVARKPIQFFDDILQNIDHVEPVHDGSGYSVFPSSLDEDWGDYDAS